MRSRVSTVGLHMYNYILLIIFKFYKLRHSYAIAPFWFSSWIAISIEISVSVWFLTSAIRQTDRADSYVVVAFASFPFPFLCIPLSLWPGRCRADGLEATCSTETLAWLLFFSRSEDREGLQKANKMWGDPPIPQIRNPPLDKHDAGTQITDRWELR